MSKPIDVIVRVVHLAYDEQDVDAYLCKAHHHLLTSEGLPIAIGRVMMYGTKCDLCQYATSHNTGGSHIVALADVLKQRIDTYVK
jgi:hypothetical protein